MVGQSTKANVIQAAMEAHIAEHIAFQYRALIEQQVGVELPPPEETLPDDVELDLSRVVAKAAEQLLQKNQKEAKQQQIQQQEEDPILQMQKQELRIKEMEAAAKAKKMADDTELDKAKLELEKMRMDSQERIAGAKIGADAVNQQKQLDSKEFVEGTKLGAQAVMQKRNNPQTKPKGN
jgi:hypothetical protein